MVPWPNSVHGWEPTPGPGALPYHLPTISPACLRRLPAAAAAASADGAAAAAAAAQAVAAQAALRRAREVQRKRWGSAKEVLRKC